MKGPYTDMDISLEENQQDFNGLFGLFIKKACTAYHIFFVFFPLGRGGEGSLIQGGALI